MALQGACQLELFDVLAHKCRLPEECLPAYHARFHRVDPFYNGQALIYLLDGR